MLRPGDASFRTYPYAPTTLLGSARQRHLPFRGVETTGADRSGFTGSEDRFACLIEWLTEIQEDIDEGREVWA
jgi:hypothetical protein